MVRKSYIVSIIFILCIGLILMGCPKKTVVKDEPSAKAEVAKMEAERVPRPRQK